MVLFIPVALVAALSAFYALTGYVALHPRVSDHYRDYYILRVTADWSPVRGTARLVDGFNFADTVYPRDVDYLRGVSAPESWGRWSVAIADIPASVVLREPLSGRLCLRVLFRVTAPLAGAPVAVRMRDVRVTVVPPNTEPHGYEIE